jgi:FtsH-binding integral membrane protein
MTGPETVLGIKLATLIAAFTGAVVSIVVDFRTHDFWTALGAVIAGVFIAAIASAPTVEFFSLSDTWANGVAGLYGIAGRNLVMWIRNAARDPASIISSAIKGWRK